MKSVSDILTDLWVHVGGDPRSLAQVQLTGDEPGLPSSFRVGAVAQSTIAAVGLVAALRHERRTGIPRTVSVGMDHAVAEFQSERFVSIDGQVTKGFRDPLAGVLPCRNGGWFRPHITFPHHKSRLAQLLGIPEDPDRATFAAAIKGWDATALEDAAMECGAVGAALRTFSEWDSLPQARAAAEAPILRIERIGDAPRQDAAPGSAQPLSQIRVLDLTRVIAGPVCGRAFAAYGAQVLAISSPRLPSIAQLVLDTNRGKFSANLDLEVEEDASCLRELVGGADIFLQSYRPESLKRRGFGPEELAQIRPGIIYAQLSAYGRSGSWSERRGFDSLVQTAMGFNHAEMVAARSEHPQELPCQVLDHACGQLLALGVMIALERRAAEGGSWLVEVSLATTGHWLRRLGRLETGLMTPYHAPDERFYTFQKSSDWGCLGGIRPAAHLSGVAVELTRATPRLGADRARWL